MKKHSILKQALSVAFFGLLSVTTQSQTNVALSGVFTHGTGGVTTYGPQNYNDQINICNGTTGTGWINGGQWIQCDWATPTSFDEIIMHVGSRPYTGGNIEYYDGTSWTTLVPSMGTSSVCAAISYKFSPVTGTVLRWNSITGSNPNFYEIEILQHKNGFNNAGVASIDSPAGGCEGTYDVVVSVFNQGNNQITTCTVEWEFNGIPQTPVTFNKLIDTLGGSGPSMIQVNLGSQVFVGGSTDNIKAWTILPNGINDSINNNDSASKSSTNLSVVSTFPYYEDFEAGQADWISGGTANSWGFGTPAKTTISGAASGINAFVTGGVGIGTYYANENSQVNSPCFDFSDFQGTPWVALDVWWDSQAGFDGAVLQSSLNGGASWENVGEFNDPNNWYNDNSLDMRPGGSTDGWGGTGTQGSGGWLRAKHTLDPSLSGNLVRFRIAFGSDGSTNYEGIAFDNFSLVDFRPVDLGPRRSLCGMPNVTLNPGIDINGILKWFDGDSTLSSYTVTSVGKYWASYRDTIIDEISSDTVEIVQSVRPLINFHGHADTIPKDGFTSLNPNLPFDLNYQWTPTGVNYPFLLVQGKDYTPGLHTFVLKVTDSLYCEDQKSVTVFIKDMLGVDQKEVGSVTFFPNPVRDRLNITMNGVVDMMRLQITDINGKIVRDEVLNVISADRTELDLSDFESGTYILRMFNDTQSVVHKIIKQQ